MCVRPKACHRKWLISLLVWLLIAVVGVAIGIVSIARRLPTPQESRESYLIWEELHKQFKGETIYWGVMERGRIVLSVYDVLDEERQNAIRDHAMAAKSRLALASKVRLEFFEKEEWTVYPPNEKGVWGQNRRSEDERILRIEEF